MKIKTLQNSEITLLFTDVSKSCASREILTSQICLLNKILAKVLRSNSIVLIIDT